MNSFKNDKEQKRILFICSPYFGYYKHIINELESRGYVVDYYNDRPSENSFIKGLVKIKRNLMDSLVDKYFENIMNETRNNKYNVVFIMNCKVFTAKMIRRLRDCQHSARFVFYMWDALALYPHAKELLPIFDKAFSFDSEDCEKVENLKLLPLFYTKPYEEIGIDILKDKYIDREYDIISVCTTHPNRYKILSQLLPYLKGQGLKIYSFMFINKLQYLYNKVFVKEFKKAKSIEFEFKSLPEEDMLSVIRNSRAVFDLQHNKQSGLTMRTIETLGSRRKLITYNTNIKKYDFYSKENVLVLNNSNWDEIFDFTQKEYMAIDDKIYKKYSLHSWVQTIVNYEDNNYMK